MGFWAVLHEIRADYAQILTSTFLLINGPGKWSLDFLLQRRTKAARSSSPAQSLGLSSAD
jgi:hypothetical protein